VTRLWLVRHGPTHEKAFTGWRDVPADLSDSAAIARLSAALPAAPVVASTLLRARQTADAIAGDRPRLPHDPDLREFDYGDWDGMTWDVIAARWPDLSRTYWEAPGDAAPPGGESWHAGEARMSAAIDRHIAAGHAELIVVVHFGVILTQLRRARGIAAAAVLAQRIDNLSVTELHRQADAWHVGRVNHRP
jgi:alpha-ribazole phosphatase